MIRSLLIIWSMLASATVFVFGLFLTLSSHGDTGAGIAFAPMSVALGWASIQLGVEEWGWRRRRSRAVAPHPVATTTPSAAKPRPRKPAKRQAERKDGARRPLRRRSDGADRESSTAARSEGRHMVPQADEGARQYERRRVDRGGHATTTTTRTQRRLRQKDGALSE